MQQLIKLDIFGKNPQFYINQKLKFKSSVGGFFTLILMLLTLLSMWIYGKDMILKQNPNTTYSEQSTMHPDQFMVNSTSFNFGIGIEDKDYNIYQDESLFTIKINQELYQNGQKTIKNLNAGPCEHKDFQISQDFFYNLNNLNNLYCIKNNAFIEGDYGADVFSIITIEVTKCQDNNDNKVVCKDPQQIENALKGNYYTIFFTDQVLDPTNFSNPFQQIGRGLFGSLSQNIYKEIEYNFRNIYLQDNSGIIFDSISEKRALQYQNERVLVSGHDEKIDENLILKMVIRLEKAKQTKVYRTYLNLAQVVANIGGIIKGLTNQKNLKEQY